VYKQSYYQDKNNTAVLALIQEFPFATLCAVNESGGVTATQIPLLLENRDGNLFLLGHVMRESEHYQALQNSKQALCIFHGPAVYVSATWYKHAHVGSTFNYLSVQASGEVAFLEQTQAALILEKLSLQFEKNDVHSPTVFHNIGDSYKKRMLPQLAAFEIKVSALEHVFKLSQDKDKESYLNVMEQLKKHGEAGQRVALEMEKRFIQVFGDK
jgi:transcriptional regulator